MKRRNQGEIRGLVVEIKLRKTGRFGVDD